MKKLDSGFCGIHILVFHIAEKRRYNYILSLLQFKQVGTFLVISMAQGLHFTQLLSAGVKNLR